MEKEIELEEKDLALDKETEEDVRRVEKDIDLLSKITFLDSLLDKQTEIRNMLDVRTNIVIGFNSALIVILLGTFKGEITSNPIFAILLCVLVLSLILAILALKPPHLSTKKGQRESLFYHHYIGNKDIEEYRQEIHQALKDENKIFDAYVAEVYNLTKYSNIPRKLYLHSSIRALIYGIGFTIVIYILSLILTGLKVI